LRFVCVAVAALALAGSAAADWPEFGYDAARHNAAPAGIAAAKVGKMQRRTIDLDGTVDSSPISTGGTIYVTTTYGRTEAVDAASGRVRWRYTPPTRRGVSSSPPPRTASSTSCASATGARSPGAGPSASPATPRTRS